MRALKYLTRRVVRLSPLPALVVAAVLATPSAFAGIIQDQIQSNNDYVVFLGVNDYYAQSFTVGVNGTLDHVDVGLRIPFPGNSAPANYNIDFGLQSLSGGVPSGTNLATGVVTPSQITPATVNSGGSYISFDVSSAHINVTSGDTFAFVLHGDAGSVASPSGDWNVMVAGTDAYSGGSEFSGSPGSWTPNTGDDAQFRTFVNTGSAAAVPEPASIALLGLGLAGLGFSRRKKA